MEMYACICMRSCAYLPALILKYHQSSLASVWAAYFKFQWREMRDPKCSNHYSISEDDQDHALQSDRFQRSGASILVQIGDITRN